MTIPRVRARRQRALPQAPRIRGDRWRSSERVRVADVPPDLVVPTTEVAVGIPAAPAPASVGRVKISSRFRSLAAIVAENRAMERPIFCGTASPASRGTEASREGREANPNHEKRKVLHGDCPRGAAGTVWVMLITRCRRFLPSSESLLSFSIHGLRYVAQKLRPTTESAPCSTVLYRKQDRQTCNPRKGWG